MLNGFVVPSQMLSFMHAQYSLFQQGFNLLHEIDPYMKKLAAEVNFPSLIPSMQQDNSRQITLYVYIYSKK